MPPEGDRTELREGERELLDRARRIARRGWGRVHPNPMVGCVVHRAGEIISEAHHSRYGGLHAERAALEAAGEQARGATVVVSLEPCSHRGKTPPCTEALVSAGVARVVYGGREPGVEEGGGGDVLRAAGIDVVGPVLTDAEARADNPAFFRRVEGGLPWVEVKLAMSLDGRIAAEAGRQTWLTGDQTRSRVHRLRSGFSAILVGSETVRADDPRLTVRHADRPRGAPWRLVVDGRCRTTPDAALFEEADEAPVVVFTRSDAPSDRIARLEEAGARVETVSRGEGGLDLSAVLQRCREMGLDSVLCEGGGRLAASLLQEGLCGRVHLYLAPRLLGAAGVPAFPHRPEEELLEGWRLAGEADTVGEDLHLVLEPHGYRQED